MKIKLTKLMALTLAIIMIAGLTACKKAAKTDGKWVTEQNYFYYDENGEWTEVSDPSLLDELAQNAPVIEEEAEGEDSSEESDESKDDSDKEEKDESEDKNNSDNNSDKNNSENDSDKDDDKNTSSDDDNKESDKDNSDKNDDSNKDDNNNNSEENNNSNTENTKDLEVIIDAYEEKFEYMYSHSEIGFDFSNSTALGDSVRAIRSNGKKEGVMVYKNDDGIAEFVIQVLHPNSVGASVNPKYYVSKDNKTYTEVKAQDTVYKPINGDSWASETIYVGGIDTANKFLKIVIPLGARKHWNPNIAHLQINGCDEEALAALGGYSSKREYSHSIYVDPKKGNDRNSGTSEKEALKSLYAASQKTYAPGDKILLKSGEKFSGSLTIIGNGSADKPLEVTTYGGSKPAIFNGRGGTTLEYYGEYITIKNLEFTNQNGVGAIKITALKPGASKGIVIKNCNFHDINTKFNSTGYASGGIYLTADGREPNWFDDVEIKDNTFDKVARTAIYVTSSWSCLDKDQAWGNKNMETGGWYPNRNITVKNNKITNNGGDSILLIGAKDSLIERNTVKDSGLFKNTGKTIAYAAIWLRDCKDTIVQYNAVYGNRDKNGGSDLQAYDSDIGCRDCIFQYNYSQDNAGGFMLLCSGVKDNNARNDGTIVRYNLSVNDGYDLDSKKSKQVIDVVDNVQNAQIYNNTIYSSKKDVVLVQLSDYGSDTKIPPVNNIFTNNIFYVKKGVKNTAFRMWDTKDATAKFINNVFYGVDVPKINGITTTGTLKDDPKLKEPGAQGGTLEEMAKKYKPKGGSYVLSKGVTVKGNNIKKDMLGAGIDSKLIGALAK
ncbi:MAG: right-handed parallel beta-helix repeat-containing protein [Clostridia bacterium]|nr:right-handed parallel beta-helix repeat-containing protein [Clostridia bacterium]